MTYANWYGLEPADRIINTIFATGLSKHHAIYLGTDHQGTEWMSENYQGHGVRMVRADVFFARLKSFDIKKLDGSTPDREAAVKRALAELGKRYDLFKYNCEHYAEFVQHNRFYSGQVEAVREAVGKVGLFLLAVGIITLFSKD